MYTFRTMQVEDAHQLVQIDRSEEINYVYEMQDGKLIERDAGHECPTWDDGLMTELQERFVYELNHGGAALGAYDGDILIGFGVLGHQFRGDQQDRLVIDLMYVSRNYRRQGIGTRIMNDLSDEARRRGAKYLYVSSTETRSAVYFYKHQGCDLTNEMDPELFAKEPLDIHMLKPL
ncbi:GNAT family N-acetyltransferase [Paenibacillus sp. SC116]|uniref:GNAT family N-acetyltransferase n=1 Tax=Paenibacillus sp. SC116 TaxID=2968986 RepID=UPI00215A5ACC|nr:GNAT family N-acetyltransferase [Paenibacillus sp. SC116]MCR8845876.1 GNAT family N-acetyltransferase [Paenibacillus sp. SC116]